jgi:ABC-2 type transport system permease protein
MLSLLNESISNAAFGIYMPKWAGTIFELLSAPVGWVEAVLGYVGAAASKSVVLGQLIPLMVRTPLTFLGGAFYSIDMLPPVWQKIALLNPVVYLISGFRWSFFGQSDVNVVVSFAAICGFLVLCLLSVWWIFRAGWRLKS